MNLRCLVCMTDEPDKTVYTVYGETSCGSGDEALSSGYTKLIRGQGGNVAHVFAGPWWLTVALVGTGVGG